MSKDRKRSIRLYSEYNGVIGRRDRSEISGFALVEKGDLIITNILLFQEVNFAKKIEKIRKKLNY